MAILPLVAGTLVRSADNKQDKNPIGKVLKHRPIRIEGHVVTYAYIVQQLGKEEYHLLMHDELSSDTT
ncbi:MAG: hypothetical protein CMG78_11980 [Marinobacter sp.]|nr:hypothetical protein [Marinobacter sp.]|tara:strand:+ start:178 stop:381 length:204 start_codon:yes stop_codon:yes gene_type:complete